MASPWPRQDCFNLERVRTDLARDKIISILARINEATGNSGLFYDMRTCACIHPKHYVHYMKYKLFARVWSMSTVYEPFVSRSNMCTTILRLRLSIGINFDEPFNLSDAPGLRPKRV